MLRFSKRWQFLGSAMDVMNSIESTVSSFQFLCNEIYLQNWTCKIGKISQCSPLWNDHCLQSKNSKHTLHLSGPYSSDDYTNSVAILNNMEEIVSQNMDQLFHDIFRLFNKQSISNHELKSSTRKKKKNPSFQPLALIQSDLPENFLLDTNLKLEVGIPIGFAYDLIRELRPRTIVELESIMEIPILLFAKLRGNGIRKPTLRH